jgi:hypothetical protein
MLRCLKGKVTLSIVDEETGSLKPLEYFTNGKDAAFSIEEQGMSVTLMMKEDKVIMVLHPMKMYMEMPIGEGDMKADYLHLMKHVHCKDRRDKDHQRTCHVKNILSKVKKKAT